MRFAVPPAKTADTPQGVEPSGSLAQFGLMPENETQPVRSAELNLLDTERPGRQGRQASDLDWLSLAHDG